MTFEQELDLRHAIALDQWAAWVKPSFRQAWLKAAGDQFSPVAQLPHLTVRLPIAGRRLA